MHKHVKTAPLVKPVPATIPHHDSFLRLPQIVGDPEANPPLRPIVPVCKSAWWAGVKAGRYPKPVKLSPRVTVWRASEIYALVAHDAKESNHG
jgi:predicted DNA-binding transcriptional regulator AlpA